MLHHDVRRVLVEKSEVHHATHVTVLQPYRELCLAHEAGRIGLRAREPELHRDLLIEMQMRRGDQDAHSTLGKHPIDPKLVVDDLPDLDRAPSLELGQCSDAPFRQVMLSRRAWARRLPRDDFGRRPVGGSIDPV